jgi:hypothetical protein
MIELTEQATEETRRDMFERINTGIESLNPMETRRGTKQGPFMELIHEMAKSELFSRLAPVSPASARRFEREELVSRFFAFASNYQKFGRDGSGKVVAEFVDSFISEMNSKLLNSNSDGTLKSELTETWEGMLAFVEKHFQNGFTKSNKSKSTPRVRFDAIAVGTALALVKNKNLSPQSMSWLNSKKFKELTTSDAANNRARVISRIEFVRDQLLEK